MRGQMITVWHDWDSGPYETISTKELKGRPTSEMSEADYAEYVEVLRRYDEWQDKLYAMRRSLECR
jgi:hypothetical protein